MFFVFKGTLAEPFKFDHDLTLGVYYENVNVPSVIVEPGDPNQGLSLSLIQRKMTKHNRLN